MQKVDYMKPSATKRIKITNRTVDKRGIPTFFNMERQLHNMMKYR